MNETMKAITQRYTCRAYKKDKVSREFLDQLVLAALAAPTAMNRQAYRVIVLDSYEKICEMDASCMDMLKEMPDKSTYERIMSRGGKLFYNAPAMLMLPMKDCGMDIGIVSENIAIAAHSLGLGSCICGMARLIFDTAKAEQYKALFNFPEGYDFGIAVLVGHPEGEGTPHAPDMEKVTYLS